NSKHQTPRIPASEPFPGFGNFFCRIPFHNRSVRTDSTQWPECHTRPQRLRYPLCTGAQDSAVPGCLQRRFSKVSQLSKQKSPSPPSRREFLRLPTVCAKREHVKQFAKRAFVLLVLFPALIANASPRRSRRGDPRTFYDVTSYILDFRVDPGSHLLRGAVTVNARVVRSGIDSLVLDAGDSLQITGVREAVSGQSLKFKHASNRLSVALPHPAEAGDTLQVVLEYTRSIPEQFGLATTGIGVTKAPGGEPWVTTSCQLTGAHWWWPCKASFFHPEDKPDSIRIRLTFPDTLFGVTNGRLVREVASEPGWKTNEWILHHPRLTYLVALYVGPYTVLKQPFGENGSDTLFYYVLRQDTAKAHREFFPRIPDELRQYQDWFGPFAFWDEKFALVQSPYAGMEHSTAVAVGPIFPHTLRPGEPNPLSWYEEYFNFMAVHEVAHEWWGNAVSARDWGEFWLHEGFATYAEALWVEHLYGPEILHEYMARLSFRIDSSRTVYQPRHKNAREAYHLNIYWKGAWVLHMLRYVMGDSQFFQALRAFNTDPRFRYGNATTADFQAVCERFYHGDLSWFFLQWIYRPGHPHFSVNWEVNGSDVKLAVHDTTFSPNQFRMPLDVILDTKAGEERHRLWVEPGLDTFELKAKAPVVTVRPVGLRWILDGPKTGTMTYFTDLDFIKGTFLDSLVFTNDRKLFVGG
ncbi:MAG TPA: M1 family peptidase, partial [Bacteroidetes bacterium]|nr:M1 family peptidase [Bacteroidota bacterium]